MPWNMQDSRCKKDELACHSLSPAGNQAKTEERSNPNYFAFVKFTSVKVSNNALNFLLAQYRAIFKRAYVKGLASAVLLTAGLAAAQAQAADLNNASGSALEAEEAITIGSGGDFDKIQISGGFTNDWNADVTITSGAASSAGNAILGSGSDNVAITGTGSLTIAVTETTPSGNGLLIVGDGKSASLTLDKVDVQRGELQVADSGSNSSGAASLVATSITIGQAAAEGEKATTTREAYLTVKTDSDAGSTLGNDQSTITVNKTGQLTLTAASTHLRRSSCVRSHF